MSSENHKVTWFAPDRPVEGGTSYVRASAALPVAELHVPPAGPLSLDNVDPTLIERLRDLGDLWGPLGVALAAAALTDPGVLVSRLTPRPRVWLIDDTVPAGVRVLAPNSYVIPPNSRPYRAATPLVEMPEMPAFGELVAAEKARRVERMDAVAEAAGDQHG